ncbi:MAG TPA: succinate dehydrogenase, hydrophobic membrane anchor protein [Caldimonas sp.]|nr:succinate dehydrogenase, hydrophobic membrane anchor protein [Caldimonas sp.]
MAPTYGSRRLVVGAHYGLRDWLSQRITAIVMAVFSIVVVVQLLMPGPIDYDRWSAMFAHQWMKVLTFIAVVSLLWHAWVGMRDIWMDYAKPVSVRLGVEVLTLAWLVGCGGWAVQVLWRL